MMESAGFHHTHIAAAKRILRYLAGTRSLGITYKRGAVDPSLLSIGMETGRISSRPARMQIMLEPMIAGVSADGLSCSLEQ